VVVEFQDGFTWPLFDVNPAVLARIGLGSLPQNVVLNLFRPQLNLWTVIAVGHVIQLTPDNTRIYLKPSNVHLCKNLITFTSEVRNLTGRIDVKRERAYMKSRLRQEELEHVLASLNTRVAKRGLSPASTAIANPPPPKRLCATPATIYSSDDDPTSSPVQRAGTPADVQSEADVLGDLDDPEPYSSPLRHATAFHNNKPSTLGLFQPHFPPLQHHYESSLQCDTPLRMPSGNFDDEAFTPTQPAKNPWPGQRSVKEIVDGFSKVEELSRQPYYTISKAFEQHFGVKFPSSTFYEHRDRWNQASQEDRDAAQASTQSWASFASSHPTSRAGVKAARKRQQKLLFR